MSPKVSTPSVEETRRRYRRQVDSLLTQLERLRQRREQLQAAGVRAAALAGLERKAELVRQELAATIAGAGA